MGSPKGVVYLVGAGPGDPSLITVRGVDCLKQAEVVVYDRLAHPSLLAYVPAKAQRIYVGKAAGAHTLSQPAISRLLTRYAKHGKRVVRLKGGDPWLFGRGAEEALVLAKARVRFEIVPGVTSAFAVPAYVGIPITLRDEASAVTVATGHEDPTKQTQAVDWEALGRSEGTLIVLMGVGQLPQIVAALRRGGKPASTPCAVIMWGTWAKQRVATGTLATIERRCRQAKVAAPAIIIIGEVVKYRRWLDWYAKRPLAGRKILVTRPQSRGGSLNQQLAALGAEVYQVPTIELELLHDARIKTALRRLDRYDWLLLTSVEGAERLLVLLRELRIDVRRLSHLKFGAIGPKTAEQLQQAGVRPDVVPATFQQEGLLSALRRVGWRGKRVLLLRAAEARDLLPEGLRKLGARVDVVPLYRAKPPAHLRGQLQAVLSNGSVDLVTFTSSGCVEQFWQALPPGLRHRARRWRAASIGPITSQAVRARHVPVAIEARQATIESLVEAIVRYCRKRGRE
ncbi:MAG: uroporphyrinogen-III C-methyltransferase [Candidatus Omnitrophica bacterium]|nr:uroporphyrinogen-III C-methyltransferase [Candidatus Omnitrophota bacterium]